MWDKFRKLHLCATGTIDTLTTWWPDLCGKVSSTFKVFSKEKRAKSLSASEEQHSNSSVLAGLIRYSPFLWNTSACSSSSTPAPVSLTTQSGGLNGLGDLTNWLARCCRHCRQIFVFWDSGPEPGSDVLAGTRERRWSRGGFKCQPVF